MKQEKKNSLKPVLKSRSRSITQKLVILQNIKKNSTMKNRPVVFRGNGSFRRINNFRISEGWRLSEKCRIPEKPQISENCPTKCLIVQIIESDEIFREPDKITRWCQIISHARTGQWAQSVTHFKTDQWGRESRICRFNGRRRLENYSFKKI